MRLPLLFSQLFLYLGSTLLLCSVLLQTKDALQKNNNFFQLAAAPTAPSTSATSIQPILTRTVGHQPTHITIPGFIDSSITPEMYRDGVWSISATAASHLNTSAYPGQPNNIIIYGHNKPSIFGPLKRLSGTEEILITLADGSIKKYKVLEIKQVTTDQLQYLHPTVGEVLTLYTCAGVFDSERLIVRALPKEGVTASAAAQVVTSKTNAPENRATSLLLPNYDSILANPFLDLSGWSDYNWRSRYAQANL